MQSLKLGSRKENRVFQILKNRNTVVRFPTSLAVGNEPDQKHKHSTNKGNKHVGAHPCPYFCCSYMHPCLCEIVNCRLSYFYRTQVFLGSDLWVRVSLTHERLCKLYKLQTLYKFNSVIQTLYREGDRFQWRHLVAKFGTNASGAIWWPNLQLMQVAPSGRQFYN